jgi:hypothetical protein
MSAFPPPCPVSLSELILANCESGRLDHLSLIRMEGKRAGMYQASFRKSGMVGYKIFIADTPEKALTFVLGPDFGHTWDEILGPEYATPPPGYDSDPSTWVLGDPPCRLDDEDDVDDLI